MRRLRRVRSERVVLDERTGTVCDANCRAAARRERDLPAGLRLGVRL